MQVKQNEDEEASLVPRLQVLGCTRVNEGVEAGHQVSFSANSFVFLFAGHAFIENEVHPIAKPQRTSHQTNVRTYLYICSHMYA